MAWDRELGGGQTIAAVFVVMGKDSIQATNRIRELVEGIGIRFSV
jgi:hypothetical protein